MATCMHISGNIIISGGVDKYLKFYRLSDNTPVTKKSKSTSVSRTIECLQIGQGYHNRKINAISGSKIEIELLATQFAVADTTADITVYGVV